ncbi:MAG: 50S ribosomal protein L25/general stress protein Ctc [Candidatus Thiodiazotropha sp. (ex Lucinoma aequizonata)]|nr:50S ribosomal protein L25/general stress protein Ctc [Candidatus Thiodiazotropha sp. (ex Lucinoma aequizonata)]MCU7889288.1 50S ribosomal protein L25/general stress protein Ctc [Candidatus Thiodiazotropha sp. (ex Lucinoma aequizonata)]MCU7895578.1 50S ribosomal protein L25/general stress protein Ctc [Candidatus Thiodiazotropha sp. (ex Lucinoma aequizonata)]MCU7900136.1 50S ribosomal protein L25/general stress protein Ctc [Candidatus Thiodiazotropha sp. (ex Lucinoma aequizonata)]MCU7902853.1 
MSANFEVNAQSRSDSGKGASRRLRRTGLVPGIVYGAHKEPFKISVLHHELIHSLENEGFYANLLSLNVDGKVETVILKDLQRHPAKPIILHVDFQRIQADEKIRLNVPVHFINEVTCLGIKSGGQASHVMTDIEISCLPKDLPEFIKVDMANMEMGAILHASDLQLPEGVELITHEGNEDLIVVTVHAAHTTVEGEEEGEEAEEGGEEATE